MKDKKSYQLNPSIDRLTLRLVLPEEQERFNDLLKQHHYLHKRTALGPLAISTRSILSYPYCGQRRRDPALCGADRRAMDGPALVLSIRGRILPAEGSRRMDRVGRGAIIFIVFSLSDSGLVCELDCFTFLGSSEFQEATS